jgi:hypothetical protein
VCAVHPENKLTTVSSTIGGRDTCEISVAGIILFNKKLFLVCHLLMPLHNALTKCGRKFNILVIILQFFLPLVPQF